MENVTETLDFQSKKIEELEKENHLLREQIRFLKLKSYGPSKDDLPEENSQLSLFEECATEQPVEPTKTETITYERRKSGRKGLNPDLPREDRLVDVPDEDKICGCGHQKACIGAESSEQLEVIPRSVKVIRTVRPKYACPHCEGIEDSGPTVTIAPVPPALIPKSMVTPSLMATVLVDKMVNALPFYRQEKQFKRIGVDLGRGSMAYWTIQMAEKVQPIVDLLVEEAKSRPAIQLDETTVQVMNEEGRKNSQKSYMWLLRAGPPKIGPKDNRLKDPNEPELVVYWYQRTRSSMHAREILQGFQGYVQTDEYRGYNFLDRPDATELGWTHVLCLAHARRNFVDAAKVTRSKKYPQGHGLAVDIVEKIKAIYREDDAARGHATDKKELVQELNDKVLPLLKDLHREVQRHDGTVPPQSKLGKALSYANRTLPKIMRFVDCPNLTMDNNDTENKVRPFALGRKNWLMANTPEGAHALATWFSLIETAKANDWEPFAYLMHLFNGILTDEPWTNLLPTRSPSTCR
jgi:transposase